MRAAGCAASQTTQGLSFLFEPKATQGAALHFCESQHGRNTGLGDVARFFGVKACELYE